MTFSKVKASLAIAALAFSSATVAETKMVAPQPDGYFVAYEAENATQSIKEEIPVGQTLENWANMITTQRFTNSQLTALQFAHAVERGLMDSCPDFAKSDPVEQSHQGYEAASFSATCYPPDETKDPETFFMMIVRAPDAIHVRQVAFREDVSAENRQAAVAILRDVIICDDDCPAKAE